jgi:hypothetical protein
MAYIVLRVLIALWAHQRTGTFQKFTDVHLTLRFANNGCVRTRVSELWYMRPTIHVDRYDIHGEVLSRNLLLDLQLLFLGAGRIVSNS